MRSYWCELFPAQVLTSTDPATGYGIGRAVEPVNDGVILPSSPLAPFWRHRILPLLTCGDAPRRPCIWRDKPAFSNSDRGRDAYSASPAVVRLSWPRNPPCGVRCRARHRRPNGLECAARRIDTNWGLFVRFASRVPQNLKLKIAWPGRPKSLEHLVGANGECRRCSEPVTTVAIA